MKPPRGPVPASPGVPLSQAMQGSEPLHGLMEKVRDSRNRLAAVIDMLPAGLRDTVRAGPLDEKAWVLLVDNAAAAAKLRQMLPNLEKRLQAAGWVAPPPKVKIQARAETGDRSG